MPPLHDRVFAASNAAPIVLLASLTAFTPFSPLAAICSSKIHAAYTGFHIKAVGCFTELHRAHRVSFISRVSSIMVPMHISFLRRYFLSH